jgi:hypothetical protein
MKAWARMPSDWLRDEDNSLLATMRWKGQNKSDQIAALMLYVVVVQHAIDEPQPMQPGKGCCALTYTQLSEITGLSRAKVAGGLKILLRHDLIENIKTGRNNLFRVANYGQASGWAKLPAKGLYSENLTKIKAFHAFHLRQKNELNALKIYLTILAFRSNVENHAKLTYETLTKYTGVQRNEVRSAISLLVNLEFIQVDRAESDINQFASVNTYRPCFLDSYRHRGTISPNSSEFQS